MEESSLSRAPSRGGVSFLNVARTYIPNTKVECHYTLPPGTVPSASDWIGIFKVSLEPFWLRFRGHGLVGVIWERFGSWLLNLMMAEKKGERCHR